MMPYYGFPGYNRYRRYDNYYKQRQLVPDEHINSHTKKEEVKEKTDRTKKADTKSAPKDDDVKIFEIFGLKLEFDTILIIGILFFLYNEGVKDQGLFISLILLLLS